MSDVGFVRQDMLPEQEPPASTIGAIGWMRENLFSGWVNTVVTILFSIIIVYIVLGLLGWALSPTWAAQSLAECREMAGTDHGKACWGVIRDRWFQLLFGFYPVGSVWRPILTFVLLIAALAPVLFSNVDRRLLWLTAAFPFLMPWLLWGGTIWGPIVVAAGVVLGVFVYRFAEPVDGSLAAIILAPVAAIIWWFLIAGPVSDGLASVVGLGLEPVASRDFGGFMLSITIGVVAIACSLPLGIVLALGRQSDLMIVKSLCVGFIEFIRGVPLITLLFVASTLLNIFMPPGTKTRAG